VARQGDVEVLDAWTNPATDRPTAISNDRLARLCRDVLPIAVEGDAVQYQVNRIPSGWVLELVNNRGVSKKKDQPAVTDAAAVAHVTLRPRMPYTTATEWRSGRVHKPGEPIEVEIGPGATEFVAFAS
jgi:hypothetical protein